MQDKFMRLTVVGFFLVVSCSPGYSADELSANRVKAACLFNFAKFIEWPADQFADAGSPLTIGIVGRDPFGEVLDETVGNKTVKGRAFRIDRFADIDDIRPCHILFVGSSERKRMGKVFERLGDASVLTIGESERFTHEGGIVRFYMEEEMVRFEINAKVAEQTGLTISAQLLKLAKITADGEE